MGHMEKQEMEMKQKLEMEIGNGNGNKKKTPITGAMFSSQCEESLLLYHLLSNGYKTGFMSWAYGKAGNGNEMEIKWK